MMTQGVELSSKIQSGWYCLKPKGETKMSEQITNELKKLTAIATDLELSGELRIQSIKAMGNIGTHEALLALLDLAANERLNSDERDLALKQARGIIKSSR